MRTLRTRFGLAALGGLILCGCICKDVPVETKVADCTNRTLHFQMTVQHHPPYQFVLGLPPGGTNQLTFRGEVSITHGGNTVARLPIGSQAITECNWLPGLSGYILTWNRTNRAERLESFLARGQRYEVAIQFSELPPPESSFWLTSMGKVGL
jgi:hypothetical protein